MSVFNTQQEKDQFKTALKEVYARNEAGEDKWYSFSDAQKRNSGYSFGPSQWGVLNSAKRINRERCVSLRRQHPINFVHLIALIFFYSEVNADDFFKPYATTARIACDSTKITATTICDHSGSAGYPACQAQEFEFSRPNGKATRIGAAGRLYNSGTRGESDALDFLAGAWTCAAGGSSSYLIVSYYNGGNCSECEWYELYNLEGKKMTKGDGYLNSFDAALKRLKIIGGWSEKLQNIPLRK